MQSTNIEYEKVSKLAEKGYTIKVCHLTYFSASKKWRIKKCSIKIKVII